MLIEPTYLGKEIPEIAMYRSHVSGTMGAVTAPNPYAAKAGLEILKAGGNAVDAAAATWLTTAVVECYHAGIGGGCFQVFYHKESNQFYSIDARGVAPLNSYQDMFLDEQGNVDTSLTEFSGRSVAAPAAYRGVDMMLKRFGTMSWREVSQAAIRLCRNGFPAGFMYAQCAANAEARYNAEHFEGFAKLYWPNGTAPKVGQRIYNPELADVIEQIAENGVDWFYNGPVAEKIVESANRYNGLLVMEDLRNCTAKWRPLVKGTYRGYEIASMYPPSSGGAHIVQMLNILENFDLGALGYHSADYTHLLAEVMKIMYADRSVAMGDPDFVNIHLDEITDKAYAKKLATNIDMAHAQDFAPNQEIAANAYESPSNTANFCIMDQYGNALVSTQTIRNWWGSGVVVDGCGFVLNNAMSDFSPKLGAATTHGCAYLSDANAIRPGATPLSSMSPTILMKNGKPYLAVGAVGGPRIISSTLQMILNVIDNNMMMDLAVREPYICCLNKTAGLELEFGFSPDTIRELERRGHKVRAMPPEATLITVPNGILCMNDVFYPGETGRVDGVAGAITSSGEVFIDGKTFV